jgi:hypothetical protein
MWDVAFQDKISNDGGAEADIVGHTLTSTLPHHWAQNGSVGEIPVAKSHLTQQFCGEASQVSTPRMYLCTCFKAGVIAPRIPDPTLQTESSVQGEKENGVGAF